MLTPNDHALQGSPIEAAAGKMSRGELEEIAISAMLALCDCEIGFNVGGEYPARPGPAEALELVSEYVNNIQKEVDKAARDKFARLLAEALTSWEDAVTPAYNPWNSQPLKTSNRWRSTNGRG